MLRYYIFEWYATKDSKYGKQPIHRVNTVRLSNPCGRTELDAKSALNIFISQNGNLKKNTIVRIKEMGEQGQIGEDITPSEDSNIIPSAK